MRSKMPILVRLTISLAVLLTGSGAFGAESVQAKHAQLELLAQSAAVAGQTLRLGVHFQLEKGWHIYWVNPGDSGQPPVFQWQLPPGFSAGSIDWPRPDRMQTSHLADYGYHDDVLLLTQVNVPRNLTNNSRAEIGLDAKWLICREVCIADHAHLHLVLPVSANAKEDANMAQLFAGAMSRMPKPMPPGWRVSASSGKDSFVLTVATGKPVGQAQFFPLQPDQIENAAPQKLRTVARGAQITLKKSDQLLKPISRLVGVLVLADDQAYTVAAPVVEQRK
jgi:DsbC/DsbD-like thiol-disulfide interchange protein